LKKVVSSEQFQEFLNDKLIVSLPELNSQFDTLSQNEIPYFSLLLAIFDYSPCPPCQPLHLKLEQITAWHSNSTPPIQKFFHDLHLRNNTVYYFKNFKNSLLIKNILKILPTIHSDNNSFYLSLNSCDLAFNLLNSVNKPLSIVDILEKIKIKTKLKIFTQNIKADGRFKSVAQTGLWGLSSWKKEFFLPVPTLIKNYFKQNNNPPLKDVLDYVNQYRDVSSNYVLTHYVNIHNLNLHKNDH
jgi:hypothetical protein